MSATRMNRRKVSTVAGNRRCCHGDGIAPLNAGIAVAGAASIFFTNPYCVQRVDSREVVTPISGDGILVLIEGARFFARLV